VGYRLRSTLPNRWVRFHSLPGSRRYANCEEDYRELLHRFNAVLEYLRASAREVFLVTVGYSTCGGTAERHPQIAELDPSAKHWRTMGAPELDVPPSTQWRFYCSRWPVQQSPFDALVRLVADDVADNVLFVASDYSWLLHPYDGGMDVVVESQEARDELRTMFAAWRSARSDGL
jgi:hypothetical protein